MILEHGEYDLPELFGALLARLREHLQGGPHVEVLEVLIQARSLEQCREPQTAAEPQHRDDHR